MAVVSVSLPDALVAEMDGAIARDGTAGRSAFVRAALRAHVQADLKLEGHIHGSITIAYAHGDEARISEARHAFHDVVLSMMHTHCDPSECMDVLLVGGPAHRVQALQQTLSAMRAVHQAVLVPVSHAGEPAPA